MAQKSVVNIQTVMFKSLGSVIHVLKMYTYRRDALHLSKVAFIRHLQFYKSKNTGDWSNSCLKFQVCHHKNEFHNIDVFTEIIIKRMKPW